jgi:hypothetical protein
MQKCEHIIIGTSKWSSSSMYNSLQVSCHSLSLPNKVWGTYCFCSISSYYLYYYYSYSFFPRSMNLSTADLRNYRTEFHVTWWSYRYMFLVDPKVFRFVVKGVKAIFLGVQGGGGYYRILWET